MSMPLLQTKLYIPPPRPQVVSRPAITAKLRAGVRRPVTLIAAPAGFGKTTLVSEWVAHFGFSILDFGLDAPAQKSIENPKSPTPVGIIQNQVAWLALDEDDNDPTRFLTYLIAALQTQQPHLGATAQGLLSTPQVPPPKAILTLLLNDLAQLTAPLVLVLDDYHLITTPAIHEALTFLVDHLPPAFHLVLTSRIDPPLPLARWRARNQLTELRADDLRFGLAEAATFLNEVMGLTLTATDIAMLETRTEGWIAGLQLAALSLQGRADIASYIQAFSGSHGYIVDYLAEEVLHRQPEPIQRFLLQTSLLARLSGPLCDAVTGREDSQRVLETLQQRNLFIVSLDDERHWFRYHHLFADVLRACLTQAQAEIAGGVAELHRRASAWHEQQGLLGEAIGHALAASAFAQVVRLLEQMGMMVFAQGASHYALQKWLAVLPAELVRRRPKLGLIHAWLLFNRMDPEAALDRLVEAEHALRLESEGDSDLSDERNTRGEIAATRAITITYSRRFDPAQVNTWAQEALAYLHPDNAAYRGLVFGALGTAAMQQGDVTLAEEHFAQAVTVSRTPRTAVEHAHMALAAVFHLTNMQRARGRLSLALAACQQTLDWATIHGAQTTFGAGMLLIQLADLLRERNDLAAALHHATAGIALSHHGAHPSLFIVGSLVLVRIKQALVDLGGVFEIVRQIRQMAANLYQADWILALLPAVEAQLHRQQGDFPVASQWAQQTDWAEPRPHHFRGTHHFVYAYEYGDITRAQVLIAQALARQAPSSPTGFVHLSQTATDPERLPDVAAYLERQGEVAAAMGLLWLRIKVHALQALVYQALGDAAQAQARLAQALVLAEPEGYVRIFVDEGEPMRLLILDFRFWIAHRAPDEQQRRLLPYIDTLTTAFGSIPPIQASPPIQNPKSKIQNLIDPLTARELEVLQLLALGLSNQEIIDKLIIAKSTLKTHINNIYSKLAVDNRLQAVLKSKELDLL